MDLDFLTKLFGGSSASDPISTLLPLLLGGKSLDLPSLLGKLTSGSTPASARGSDYPPLFGEKRSDAMGGNGGLFNLLGGMLKGVNDKPTNPQNQKEFPYELQYNHPYSYKNKEKVQ